MPRVLGQINKADALATVLLAAFPFFYFYPVTLGQAVWFTRDLSRMYYPLALELGRALNAGRLPLWSPQMQAGFPLLAEGQIAAFYLPQLVFVKIFPAHFAVSYEMLFHLAFATVGMYACMRGLGARVPSSLLAGFAFSFTGFLIQKLYHAPILFTAAWLPWLVFFQTQFQLAQRDKKKSAGIWFALVTLAATMQWLAGSVQTALLNSIAFAAFSFFGGVFWNATGEPPRRQGQKFIFIPWRLGGSILWTLAPLILSLGIAAIQLLPTAELIGYSVRARGLNDELISLYSLSSDSLRQFFSPFAMGEPSDDNVELWGYVGLSVLIWAFSSIFIRRDAKTIFCFAFALITLSLALGEANPLFHFLARLPVFNLFRVPARYVFLFAFSAAMSAALTLDGLLQRAADARPNLARALGVIGVLVTLGVIVLAHNQPLEFWLGVWQWLPWAIGLLALVLLGLGWTRRLASDALAVAIIALVVVDLSANAATFLHTRVAELTPPAYVEQIPRSVTALGTAQSPERIYTDETVWPSVPGQRSSLYPNFGLVYGREMAHAYTPLLFGAGENYFYNLSPAMLNLYDARYFAIPLEPRAADRTLVPYSQLTLDVVDNETIFPPTYAVAIQIDSFTEETASLSEGAPIAELIVKFNDGASRNFVLRAGIETGDWDFGKGNPPSRALITHRASGFLRAAGRTFDALIYRAQFDLGATARKIISVNVHPLIPKAHFTVERIAFVDEKANAVSLAALTNKDEFKLAFMSDTAVIWENLNILPRAFIAHRAEVMNADAAFKRLQEPGFRSGETVLLSSGSALDAMDGNRSQDRVEITHYLPERVNISVTTDRAGYLVLSDSFYPGWNAFVDGTATPIERADYLFRAVPVSAGAHVVTFEYRSASLMWGGIISIASLAATAIIALAIRRGSA